VRYVGEAVAAVVATSRYLAKTRLELIEIEVRTAWGGARSEQAVADARRCCTKAAGTNVLIAASSGKAMSRRT